MTPGDAAKLHRFAEILVAAPEKAGQVRLPAFEEWPACSLATHMRATLSYYGDVAKALDSLRTTSRQNTHSHPNAMKTLELLSDAHLKRVWAKQYHKTEDINYKMAASLGTLAARLYRLTKAAAAVVEHGASEQAMKDLEKALEPAVANDPVTEAMDARLERILNALQEEGTGD